MDEGFEEFWKRYPREMRHAKGDARKAWRQMAHVRPTLAEIFTALDRATVWRAARARAGKFAPEWPYPATWLRRECWDDACEMAPTAGVEPAATLIDERAQQQRERERFRVMRARSSWQEVVAAARTRSVPITGWSEPDTDLVLRTIGGFLEVCNCTSRKALHEMAIAFERAWVAPESAAPSRSNVVQLRAANG